MIENEEEILNLITSENCDDVKLACCILSKCGYEEARSLFKRNNGNEREIGINLRFELKDAREETFYMKFNNMSFYISTGNAGRLIRLKSINMELNDTIKTFNYE